MSAQKYLILDPSFFVNPDKLEEFGKIEDSLAEGGSKPEIILPSILQSIDPQNQNTNEVVSDIEPLNNSDLRDVLTAWGIHPSEYEKVLEKLLSNKHFTQFFNNPDRRDRIKYPKDLGFIPPEKLGKNCLQQSDVYKFLGRVRSSAANAVKKAYWEIISLGDKFKANIVVCNKKLRMFGRRIHIQQWGFYGTGGIALCRFIIDKLPADALAEMYGIAPESALLLLSSFDMTGISLALWTFHAAHKRGAFEKIKEHLSSRQEQSKYEGCMIYTPYEPKTFSRYT